MKDYKGFDKKKDSEDTLYQLKDGKLAEVKE